MMVTDMRTIQKHQLEIKIKLYSFFSFVGKIWIICVLSLIPISILAGIPEKASIHHFDILFFIILLIPPLGIVFLCKRAISRVKNNLEKLRIKI